MNSSPVSAKISHSFLGFPVAGKQKILLLAPNEKDLSEVSCELLVNGLVVATQVSRFRDEIVRLYEFSFENLQSGSLYHYRFRSGDARIDLGGGLEEKDLYFTFVDRLEPSDSVILMSCNGVNDFHGKDIAKFAMWERLLVEIDKMKTRPKLLILGGDQYYQDAIETKWLNNLDKKTFEEKRGEFKQESLANALEHMNDISYRKLMAQIPSCAMMDDHDITDGAAGRSEFFDGNGFTEQYQNFAKVQLELFDLLQASRNPPPIMKNENTGYSCIIDLGDTALVALDLRSQKNAKTKCLMNVDTEAAVLKAVENLSHKNVMVLIPVVPLRNSIKLEGFLLAGARLAAACALSITPKGIWDQKLRAGLQHAASLEDDLLDALSSETNIGFLANLLKTLAKGARRGVKYTILSGDIHTGGTIETKVTVDNFTFKLPILVSSPMGYQPMNYLVETFLRERKVLRLQHDGVDVQGVNNWFTSQRNFMRIEPSKLGTELADRCCALYYEGVDGFKYLQTDSWSESKQLHVEEMPSINFSKTASKKKSDTPEATM